MKLLNEVEVEAPPSLFKAMLNGHVCCRTAVQRVLWSISALTVLMLLYAAAAVVIVVPDQRDAERGGRDADVSHHAALSGLRVLPRRVSWTHHHQGRFPPPSHHTHLLTLYTCLR